jgi:hypothetical protein
MTLTEAELKLLRETYPNIDDGTIALNSPQQRVVNKEYTITGNPITETGQQNKAAKKGNKYHVSPREDRTYNGIVYDSKKEMLFAQELDLRVRAGEITFWLRQVPFVVGYDPLTVYKADFVTFSTPGLGHYWVTVIEVKPKDKKAWAKGAARKLKLFRKKFPHLKLEIV